MKIKITLRHRACLRVDGGAAAATTGHVRVTFFSVFGIAPRNRGPRSSLAFYSLLPILSEDKHRERDRERRKSERCSTRPTPNRPRSGIHRTSATAQVRQSLLPPIPIFCSALLLPSVIPFFFPNTLGNFDLSLFFFLVLFYRSSQV